MSDPVGHTTLQLIDFAEQGEHDFVLFTPTRDSVAIAIDTWRVSDLSFTGYVGNDIQVALPAETGWIVYSKKLVRRLTRAESIQAGLAQTKREYEIKAEFLKGLKADEADGVAELAPEAYVVGGTDHERRGYL